MSVVLPFDIVELAPCSAAVGWVPPAAPLSEISFRSDAWTADEIRLLRERFAADEAVSEIAETLGRGLHGVRTKICELGLRRNSARPWTEMDDEFMARHYGVVATSQVAQGLGRSASAIYARATILGLTEGAPPPWTAWEDAQLVAGYQQAVPVLQLAVLIGRPMSGVVARAATLGLRHPNRPEDWSEAEQARALELAEEGLRYLKIIEVLASEGFAQRSKAGLGTMLRKMGYERGWGRPWLPEEDEALRAAYAQGKSLVKLGVRLGRTKCSVRWRSDYLGLRGTHCNKNGFLAGEAWSDDEDALLRQHYGKMKTKDLAVLIGRPKGGVLNRAWQLGLKHGYCRRYSDDERRAIVIAHGYGVSLSDLADALERDAAVVSKTAHRMGLRFDQRAPGKKAPKTPRSSRPKLTLTGILALAGEVPQGTVAEVRPDVAVVEPEAESKAKPVARQRPRRPSAPKPRGGEIVRRPFTVDDDRQIRRVRTAKELRELARSLRLDPAVVKLRAEVLGVALAR